jgi:ATPase family associated with various cellular activities (AAA)
VTSDERLLGGVAIAVGFVAAVTGYVKSLVGWLRGFLVVSVWIDDNALRAVASYLNTKGRRVGGPRAYAAETRYMRGQGHSEVIPFEELDRASSMFWLGRRPVWVTKADKPLSEHHISFRLSVIRGLLNPERIIVDACAWASEDMRRVRQRHRVIHHHGRSLTMDFERNKSSETVLAGRNLGQRGGATRLIGHAREDIEPPPIVETLDDMVMTREVRSLTGAIRRWFSDRLWCTGHGIPWRAGFLYEGEPGSGKTSHARCVAVDLDLPVHVFDLATMNNEDLRRAWLDMVSDAPCMALIEDIDRVFDGDRNVAPPSGMLTNSGLTFNALLNAIDGIERHDGVLLIVTTNHVDKVDPAIKDRKGRIDRVVRFDMLDYDERILLAARIVEDPILAAQLAVDHGGKQISAFVSACCDAARRGRYEPKVDLGPMRTAP